jgi:hypothetical protein
MTLYRVFEAECDLPRCYTSTGREGEYLGRERKFALTRIKDAGWVLLARGTVLACPKHNTQELRGGHTPVLEATQRWGQTRYLVHCACGARESDGGPHRLQFAAGVWHEHLVQAAAAAGEEWAVAHLRRRAEYAAKMATEVEGVRDRD